METLTIGIPTMELCRNPDVVLIPNEPAICKRGKKKTPWDVMKKKLWQEPDSRGNPSSSGWQWRVGCGIQVQKTKGKATVLCVVKRCSVCYEHIVKKESHYSRYYYASSSLRNQIQTINLKVRLGHKHILGGLILGVSMREYLHHQNLSLVQ